MDASTTAAAALAIAVAASEQSAMDALLLERERLAMIVEDQASFLAQRHWVGTLHLQRLSQPMTWRELYEQRHRDLEHAWAAMRVALHAHRRGDTELAEQCCRRRCARLRRKRRATRPVAPKKEKKRTWRSMSKWRHSGER